MFEYEHTSKFNVSTESRESLIKEIEGEEFHLSPLQGKILLNDAESIFDGCKGKRLDEIESEFSGLSQEIPADEIHSMFRDLKDFISIRPRLPDPHKDYIRTEELNITPGDSREEIMDMVAGKARQTETALLTLYIYRQMDMIDWLPFIKAAIERNPVCFTDLAGRKISDIYNILLLMPDESIYDGQRLALPDEVWNFKRGDGIEKAILMADLLIHHDSSASMEIEIDGELVLLKLDNNDYYFASHKNFRKSISINGAGYEIT